MERRLAAIVCADVAGYSRMMGTDEAGTHATFKAHRSAIHPIILNHGGRLVKNTGDGFLLEFPSIVGAVEAAIEMQTLMAERNDHLPADRAMQFRLGIHMGDVMADEDEVFGDDVNIAVRLESVASPRRPRDLGQGLPRSRASISASRWSMPATTASRTSRSRSRSGPGIRRIRRASRTQRKLRASRRNTGPRSSACCRSPISATPATNIFPTA